MRQSSPSAKRKEGRRDANNRDVARRGSSARPTHDNRTEHQNESVAGLNHVGRDGNLLQAVREGEKDTDRSGREKKRARGGDGSAMQITVDADNDMDAKGRKKAARGRCGDTAQSTVDDDTDAVKVRQRMSNNSEDVRAGEGRKRKAILSQSTTLEWRRAGHDVNPLKSQTHSKTNEHSKTLESHATTPKKRRITPSFEAPTPGREQPAASPSYGQTEQIMQRRQYDHEQRQQRDTSPTPKRNQASTESASSSPLSVSPVASGRWRGRLRSTLEQWFGGTTKEEDDETDEWD